MRDFLFKAIVVPVFGKQLHQWFDAGVSYGQRISSFESLMEDDMKAKGCKAIQMSDNMVCRQCGVRWDANDPEPPECRQDVNETERDAKAANANYLAFKNNYLLPTQQGGSKK